MNCTNCKTTIIKDARFCHGCGEKIEGKPIDCPSCTHKNEPNAKFCSKCGCALAYSNDFATIDYTPKFPLNFEHINKIPEQIGGHFFAQLKQRLRDEHDVKKYEDYVSIFYDSGFDNRFNIRASQLAEEAYTIHCRQDVSIQPEIDALLTRNFEGLLDHFIIMQCNHLNEFPLSESILKYENSTQTDVNLSEMIFDYLQIEEESNEKLFLDFVSMPTVKLKNAAKSFLFADKKEKVYLICDQTVFGSCKEGFAITERGIYWKAHFNRAYRVHFDNLQEIKREKDWISINGRYFHVNNRFNLKLLKLLKRLKRMF
ncbi:MAG: zinc ribbon domain-containing protein [Saprospiraceae bacterium]